MKNLRPLKFTLAVIAAILLAAWPGNAAEELTYRDLVRRLTDLEWLATLPPEGNAAAQWSSYDRASRFDAATGKYVGWDANGDGHGIIRKEGNEQVLAEMTGPGCIWRIWSATPKAGHVRMFIDGASEPVVDLPFVGYFDRKNAPFTRASLVHTVAKGWNNYTPIPYQKSCKIVADPGWGDYYHFNYETFPPGTRLPSFQRQLSVTDSRALDEADRILSGGGPREEDYRSSVRGAGRVETDEWTDTAELNGPAAITGIRVRVQLPSPPLELDALRAITLQIRWDGESAPSVWAPLGDFFGTAPGANPYRSLPMGLTQDGWWYCNWFMPFENKAEVTIRKESSFPVKLEYQIATKPLQQSAAKYARFHAKWHRDIYPPAEPERAIDWTVVKTEGTGRFVGMMLHIWNPRGGWWGEGDEKFFVDGEKFPSTIGTGSEDYFGYAWCNPGLFQNAFHNQTRNDGNNRGHVSVNRWQVVDSIPFHRSFEGCIEKYYPNQRPTLYAATAFWYLATGGRDPYQAAPLGERIGYWTPVPSSKIKGVVEGESLKVLSKSRGEPQEQDLSGFGSGWSNDAQLWWIQAQPGDKLELGLPVAKAGKYKLSLQMTKARDYGIVQLYLDDQKLGTPVDLYSPSVVPTGPQAMGSYQLTAGDHKLRVEILGANPKALKAYMFGLDYVRLDPE